jgi:tRNA threonylcarbamoyladenosine biosynthesis protein TsaB
MGGQGVKVLALETSTAQSSVCLASEDGLLAGATLGAQRGRAHNEFLVPAVDFCLRRAHLTVDDLTGIAVGLGPGLYTGMRVGIATATTFAHARGLPMVGVASLDLLAFPVRHVRRLLCPAIDARRGELFWAFYRAAPGGVQRLTDYRVGAAGKLAGEIEAVRDDVLCVGDGAIAQHGLLESAGAEIADPAAAYPTAQALAELALPRFRRGEGTGPAGITPIYLRRPDARISWQTRAGVTAPGVTAPRGTGDRAGREGGG